jgi:GDP/UDP-N,N'-diacetylbacillosamine 2-epimerase (hydrolysing)
MSRKICVITGSRAEYGLLRWIMQGIKDHPDLTLQLIATGMHLSEDFGMTVGEIEYDGFKVNFKVESLDKNDSAVGIAGAMSRGLSGVAKALDNLKPDLILVLGDRYEIFVSVAAALVAKIPVAHIHGGELTIGAFDDALRHAITKMSHLHFVATQEYGNRVIQLGENPRSVHLIGGLGVDTINKLKLLDRKELEKELDLVFNKKNLLITFHPATLDESTATSQMRELLSALSDLKDTTLIFTMPNADTGGLAIMKIINNFVAENPNAHAFTSLGQLKYLSCILQVDGVVGNSSSGLTEVPSFKKGTINIGDRQKGRLQAQSIINCEPKMQSIVDAIDRLYSEEFKNNLMSTVNPYGQGGASDKIIETISKISLSGIVKKTFYDLDYEYGINQNK